MRMVESNLISKGNVNMEGNQNQPVTTPNQPAAEEKKDTATAQAS